MNRYLLLLLLLLPAPLISQVDFTGRIVAEKRSIPWDMLEAPDGMIWYTERVGLVSRIHPDSSRVDTLLDMRGGILNLVEVGLLSIVLHPGFPDTPYVYLSYVFKDDIQWVKHVARFTYNGKGLVDEKVIYELRPAELWHQGCRMAILPDHTMLFTNGDQPAPDSTYSPTSEIGKILRINLDGTIPEDNPYPNNRVWSRGHRNPQGLCVLPNGLVYSSEHGNAIEDEINLIVKDGNYGWPKVEGMCDTPAEIEFCEKYNVIQPVWSSGTNQTYAPAGLEYYNSDRYPALQGKLISTHLRTSRIMAHSLSVDQRSITETTHYIQYRYGRIRDVLILRNGRIFVCTGNVGYEKIEPFPKQYDDVIVELLPVWKYEKPDVVRLQDTFFLRANPGDTVRSFVPFCNTTSATVNFLHFDTRPDNIIKQRHWQDAATVEGSNCWPFRIQYEPDSAFPHIAQATVWYDNRNGGRDSAMSWVIGLPYKGYLHPLSSILSDTSRNRTCSFDMQFTNIGDTAVNIFGWQSDIPGLTLLDGGDVLRRVEPGQVLTIRATVDRTSAQHIAGVFTLANSGLHSSVVQLNATFLSDTTAQTDVASDVTPFPVQDVLIVHNVPKGNVAVKVFDIQGREVYVQSVATLGTIRLPTDLFVASADNYGVYAVVLTTDTFSRRHIVIVGK